MNLLQWIIGYFVVEWMEERKKMEDRDKKRVVVVDDDASVFVE